MGWEWHNRRRKNGKFMSDWAYEHNGAPNDQIHVRTTKDEAKAIREAAAGNQRELNEYCRAAIMAQVKRDQANRANWAIIPTVASNMPTRKQTSG